MHSLDQATFQKGAQDNAADRIFSALPGAERNLQTSRRKKDGGHLKHNTQNEGMSVGVNEEMHYDKHNLTKQSHCVQTDAWT